jgi:hypothetical protein
MGKKRSKPEVITPSMTSPQGGGYGCLCKDGTYHPDCCNGDLHAQGVGQLYNGSERTLNQEIVERIITRDNG